MNRRHWLSLGFAACASAFVAACSGTEDGGVPQEQGGAASQLAGGDPADAACGKDAGSTSFFSCTQSSDCVAVRELFDCCDNGWKIAVNREEARAYLAATYCVPRVCPYYVVDDTRVPVCNPHTLSCEMVKPGVTSD
jgi:hypothetical protein